MKLASFFPPRATLIALQCRQGLDSEGFAVKSCKQQPVLIVLDVKLLSMASCGRLPEAPCWVCVKATFAGCPMTSALSDTVHWKRIPRLEVWGLTHPQACKVIAGFHC